jgi:hypothetical protein
MDREFSPYWTTLAAGDYLGYDCDEAEYQRIYTIQGEQSSIPAKVKHSDCIIAKFELLSSMVASSKRDSPTAHYDETQEKCWI